MVASSSESKVTKKSLPSLSDTLYGCLPELEFDGETLGQSHSIARFLAKEFGLAGKTNVEAAKADGIVEAGKDIVEAALKFKSHHSGALQVCVTEYRRGLVT